MTAALASRPGASAAVAASPRRHARLSAVTGRELAAHRLLMGVARTALAAEMRVNHYRLAAAEGSVNALDAKKAERWRAALRVCAQHRLDHLAHQGFALEELPPAMRETFALYVTTGHQNGASHA